MPVTHTAPVHVVADAAGRRAELLVQAMLHEYDALRAEVMSLQGRTHQLLAITLGGAGAVLSSGALGAADDILTMLAFGAAALLGLVAVVYIGHDAKQGEIGTYLCKQALELRQAVHDLDPSFVQASTVMAWEDRSLGSSSISRRVESWSLWIANAMQAFELIALGAIPFALWIGGLLIYSGSGTARTAGTTVLLVVDIVILVIIGVVIVGTVRIQGVRNAVRRRDYALAQTLEWDGGPLAGVRRLDQKELGQRGQEFVDNWIGRDDPPTELALPGGVYEIQGRATDGWAWSYRWRPTDQQPAAGSR